LWLRKFFSTGRVDDDDDDDDDDDEEHHFGIFLCHQRPSKSDLTHNKKDNDSTVKA
jgi:hypothetical protein